MRFTPEEKLAKMPPHRNNDLSGRLVFGDACLGVAEDIQYRDLSLLGREPPANFVSYTRVDVLCEFSFTVGKQ